MYGVRGLFTVLDVKMTLNLRTKVDVEKKEKKRNKK